MTRAARYRWDRILVLAGPISWLIAIGCFLLALGFGRAWTGVAVIVYSAELLFWSHWLLALILIGHMIRRYQHKQVISRWLRWGLVYYLSLPLLIFGTLLLTQGVSVTIEILRYLLRMPLLSGL
jgi:hypothetical protein